MKEKNEVDLLEVLNVLKDNIITIIITTFIVAMSVFVFSKFLLTPKYESSATMIIGSSQQEKDENKNLQYYEIQANKALVSTYSEVVKSKGIANHVINNLNLDMDYREFAKKVSIEPVKDTQIISVKVIDTIPERAADIANETSKIFKESITEIMKVDNVQILDKAILPEGPSSPNIIRNTIAGGLFGLFLGIIIVLIRVLSDNTFKSIDDVTHNFDIPVLGMIPNKSIEK
ncbi:lipopolysaccharide chain length-determining protein [Anaerococcus sp. AGMB00486]|uniref:Lipopolysaccharide chain length-determining protein n=1 Tax=Anaerococcus faecalis TaxID=2742993 RepID=A0ABX2NA03_9FIRM|nr:Wzz/FepE/Etk N-terminal domain-containing protein [Anaerococcus faecalis]NVF11542.1 lipopolysaccharide chain length-determining protein [Anaerococcus faecalis]